MDKDVEKVTDRKRGYDEMKKFDKSEIGGEFWDIFHEIIDSNDSIVFQIKLKHKIDEFIEDQVLYVLANAISK